MQTGDTVQITIDSLGSHGEGVGKLDGYTLFIDDALPQETVEAKLTEQRKRYGKAELLSIITPSPDRVTPPCPIFGKCGGCQIMHLSYEKQLEMKQQKVIDALTRIGGIEATVAPCIASPSPLHYRNKIQLPAQMNGSRLSLGLYERNSHNLVEVQKCYIHCELGEEVFKKVKGILQMAKVGAELRHLLIKSAIRSNESLVIFVTKEPPSPKLKEAAIKIMASCPTVKGVLYNLHEGEENVILGPKTHPIKGQDHILETICELTFKISPESFFQVNPAQAEQLYTKALEFADLTGKETVLDAYCGVGTLSLLFAQKAKKVIGVECVERAVTNARENAKTNKIHNVEFITADASVFISKAPAIDLLLLNPPRKGCDPAFLHGIGKLKPKTLLYISCDPATLSRDLKELLTFGYTIEQVQPFDMFPQTAHVETLVKLTLAKQ